MRDVMDSLRCGCDILIGTPGRISDLVDQGIISFEGVMYESSTKRII